MHPSRRLKTAYAIDASYCGADRAGRQWAGARSFRGASVRQSTTCCSRVPDHPSHPVGRDASDLGRGEHYNSVSMEEAWRIVQAAALAAEAAERAGRPELFALGDDLQLCQSNQPQALLAWHADSGWEALLPDEDPAGRSSICTCRSAAPRAPVRSRSAISARASTGSSPPMPASHTTSPATRTSCTCTACGRCATRSSSAPARSRPTIPS